MSCATKCADCDSNRLKLKETELNCQRLLLKLREYQMRNEQLESYISSLEKTVNQNKLNMNKLIFNLDSLLKTNNGTNKYEVSINIIDIISKELELTPNAYTANLKKSIDMLIEMLRDDLVLKATSKPAEVKPPLVADLDVNLDEVKKRTVNLKEKIDNQNRLIKNLLETYVNRNNEKIEEILSMSRSDNSGASTPSSSSLTSSFYTPMYDPSHSVKKSTNQTGEHTYACPLCKITIDSNQISQKKFEAHVTNCEPKAQHVCMFCLKIYKLEELDQFEAHVQRHLVKSSLTKSPTTTTSTHYFNLASAQGSLANSSGIESTNFIYQNSANRNGNES